MTIRYWEKGGRRKREKHERYKWRMTGHMLRGWEEACRCNSGQMRKKCRRREERKRACRCNNNKEVADSQAGIPAVL